MFNLSTQFELCVTELLTRKADEIMLSRASCTKYLNYLGQGNKNLTS